MHHITIHHRCPSWLILNKLLSLYISQIKSHLIFKYDHTAKMSENVSNV
jgi:hypothetical protein